jgi:hypothetical protein
MLLTNQRLDKLAAARVDFRTRGMLSAPLFGESIEPEPPGPPPSVDDAEDDDDGGAVEGDVLGEVILAPKPSTLLNSPHMNFRCMTCVQVPNLPRTARELGEYLNISNLWDLISRFLYKQENPDSDIPLDNIPVVDCPQFEGNICVFPSAVSIYYAPSDRSGIQGMFRERIRAVSSLRWGPARYDCVFVEWDPDLPGFQGLYVARVLSFFSITHNRVKYPCALVS